MSHKKKILYLIIPVLCFVVAFIIIKSKSEINTNETVKEINPTFGTIQNRISTTGTVLPKNRLEIKPPVNGRIETILVKEGEKVKTGQILAWMSSTERAALLDAARGKSEAVLKYWQEAYKPIALLAPIDGEVIVATTQPGQTVTTNDAVVVLSDQLITRAQVDETDIGRIKLNQNAIITLDAYPEVKIKASVEHIYYESQTLNNVTIYKVDLIPQEVPSFFRSGMNATIEFIVHSKENALLIPLEAIQKDKEESFVFLKKNGKNGLLKQPVKLGLSDDKKAEIISGVSANDTIVMKSKKYTLPSGDTAGSNPFMPFGRRRGSAR